MRSAQTPPHRATELRERARRYRERADATRHPVISEAFYALANALENRACCVDPAAVIEAPPKRR